MDESEKPINLDLWLNEDLIRQQNLLKSQFIHIFKEVGNAFVQQNLSDLSPNAKASKISRGNDLNGLPYQVLDLIRDFDPLKGANIRLLNWFGVGFFITVLLGKSRINPTLHLLNEGYSFSLCESQWDYPSLILNKNQTDNPEKISRADFDFHHWIKALIITPDPSANASKLIEEVKKILAILRLPNQHNRI